jgi:hypothetical protein
MVDIKSKKCISCNIKYPSFNYENETKPLYCSSCKLPDMVDIKNKKCLSCNIKLPSCNYENETKPLYCSSCKLPDMVDIINKKCLSCNIKQPSFNYENETKPLYCSSCKLPDMVDIISKKCLSNFCLTRANKKYNGYCAFCFQNIFPTDPLSYQIRTKSKEILVRDFINSNYDGFYHDKKLEYGGCDCNNRRRIDHRKLINNTLICIETDENQHKAYSKKDEEKRYNDILVHFTSKYIFIRFNPDKYINNKNKSVNPKIVKRLERLKEEIDKQIKRILDEENKELLEIYYLFYDGYNYNL